MKTIILPGWAVPVECYRELPFSDALIFDYGFYRKDVCFATEEIISEIAGMLDSDTLIAAHSLGSVFALKLAAESEKVKGLVLFASFARFAQDKSYPGQPEKMVKAMILQLKRNPERLLTGFFENMATPEKYGIVLPEEVNTQSLVDGLQCLLDFDVRSILDRVKCPVFVVSGDQDKIAAYGQTRFLAENLEECEFCEIPGAGHAVPFTCIDRYKEKLNQFIQSV